MDQCIINPMVKYLNSLRTQQEGANATYVYETRSEFLDQIRKEYSWFPSDEQLHVATALDGLAGQIAANSLSENLIFLTGDAGDGKTEFCAHVVRALGEHRRIEVVMNLGRWCIVKDASEIPDEELLSLISQRFGKPEAGGLLVAINEGRLRRLAECQPENEVISKLWEHVIRDSLEVWLDEGEADQLDGRMGQLGVLVINFRQRFHVRTTAPSLLNIWTDTELWEKSNACSQCSAADCCPILANVQNLRDNPTQELITDVLAAAHFNGQRLPFRRLQGVLAACATGGLECEQVQSEEWIEKTSALDRLSHRFYSLLFGLTSGSQHFEVTPEPVSRSLTSMDPGGNPFPEFDSEVEALVTSEGDSKLSFSDRSLPPPESAAVKRVRSLAQSPELSAFDNPLADSLAVLTENLRRLAWLTTPTLPKMQWRESLQLLEKASDEDLKAAVVRAINRIHRSAATRTETITQHQLDPSAFRDLAHLALELDLGVSFKTKIRRGPILPKRITQWLEWSPSEVVLAASPADHPELTADLKLDTRLVECSLAIGEGYVFLGALGPYRRDLGRFHSLLAARAVSAGSKPSLLVRIESRSYKVDAVQTSSKTLKLRFEGQG